MTSRYIKKFLNLLFLIALVTLAITFFTRSNYKKIDNINPAVLNEPQQVETDISKIIKFTKDDYEYELTPLYDYEVNGLIVHRMDYRWFSIYKRDSVFPLDVCITWGDNIASKAYQNKTLRFSQDYRFCNWFYTQPPRINNNEVANVHLIINNEILEKKIKQLFAGDQVRLQGKLVNVKAKNIGEPGKYDPENFEMQSSTARSDSGAGACEVLYVEDITILQKGNPISYFLFRFCLYFLAIIIIIKFIWFIIEAAKA